MYKVIKENHQEYGRVVEITRVDSADHTSPFDAFNKALKMRRLWKEKTKRKVRFLVDSQILTPSQLETWANEEYRSLPKCEECGAILAGNVYTHSLSEDLFCSQKCADKNHDYKIEKMNDNDEHEFDL